MIRTTVTTYEVGMAPGDSGVRGGPVRDGAQDVVLRRGPGAPRRGPVGVGRGLLPCLPVGSASGRGLWL